MSAWEFSSCWMRKGPAEAGPWVSAVPDQGLVVALDPDEPCVDRAREAGIVELDREVAVVGLAGRGPGGPDLDACGEDPEVGGVFADFGHWVDYVFCFWGRRGVRCG